MKCMKYGIFIFWSKLSNMKEVLCKNKCMCDVCVRVLLRFFIKRTFGLLIGRRAWEPFTTFYCFALSVIYTLECSCSSCKTVVKLFTQRQSRSTEIVQVLWGRWFVLKTELAELGVDGMRQDCLHFGAKCSSDRDVLAICTQVLGAPLYGFKSKFCKLNLFLAFPLFLKASLIYNPPQSSSFLGMRQVDSGQRTDGW